MRAEFQEGFSLVVKVWPNVTTRPFIRADFQEAFILVGKVCPIGSPPQSPVMYGFVLSGGEFVL